MNKRQLLELIAEADDEDEILVAGPDHSPRPCYLDYGTVLENKEEDLTEDFGETLTPQMVYGKRKPCLFIRTIY